MGSSTENSAFGPVRNPWDRGARARAAPRAAAPRRSRRGLAPWALGTDTGGSIRQPAALCGIVGLKPTYGAVSRFGMIAFASSLDQAGPLTRDVTDAALLLLRQMVGARDPCDSTSLDFPEPIELPTRDRSARRAARRAGRAHRRGHRAGRAARLRGDARAGARRWAPASSRARCRTLRTRSRPTTCSRPPRPPRTSPASTASATATARAAPTDLLSMYTRTRHDGFGAEVKRRIMLGTYALSSGYYDAYYGRAQRVRTKIAEDFAAAFERFDFIVTPTAPGVAFALGAKTADPLAMYLNDFCTVPMSLAGIPAISIPCGLARAAGRRPGRSRSASSSPARRSARTALLGRGVRARAGARLRRQPPLRRRVSGRRSSRSSAWRSTSSSRPRRRCSAAAR